MAGERGKWVVMVTAQTPTNIAVIKYWGKRDETLIVPVNDSISVTLDPDHLCTTTTVAVSPAFDRDRMWLNGKVNRLNCVWLMRKYLLVVFLSLMKNVFMVDGWIKVSVCLGWLLTIFRGKKEILILIAIFIFIVLRKQNSLRN